MSSISSSRHRVIKVPLIHWYKLSHCTQHDVNLFYEGDLIIMMKHLSAFSNYYDLKYAFRKITFTILFILRCRTGDMSLRHSLLTLSALKPNRTTYSFIDLKLQLSGPYTGMHISWYVTETDPLLITNVTMKYKIWMYNNGE